jgi:glycoprotein 6-alpha-L-fucosyltransferase
LNLLSLHIRRGDKVGGEALYFDVEQYMFYVVNYFKKLTLKGFKGERVIFVASDEANVTQELIFKFPDFKFINHKLYFDEKNADSKRNPENLLHAIIDIHFLARSDFIVCTMSSNVRVYISIN